MVEGEEEEEAKESELVHGLGSSDSDRVTRIEGREQGESVCGGARAGGDRKGGRSREGSVGESGEGEGVSGEGEGGGREGERKRGRG